MRGGLYVRSGDGYWSIFHPNLQKIFISAKFVTLSCHAVLFVTRFKLLLNSSFLSFSAKLAMSSYRLQGHEGRSVQFKLSLVSVNFNASCELHRPAFMTLEPIRWHCKFCWELRNDEYNNNIKLITNTTTWRESLTNLAEINNFWGFGRNVDQYRSGLRTYRHPLLSMQ